MACWLLVLCLSGAAQAATPGGASCTVQVLSVAAAQGDDQGNRPEAGPWQAVTLPDDWSRRWPQHDGTVWYRLQWQRDCAAGQRMPVALTLRSVIMAGEVFVNDQRLWRDSQLSEPLSRSWNMPRYWHLPEGLLHEGVNTLWVRVVGLAVQSPGLGPVYLGDEASARQLYEELLWTNRSLFVLNLTVSAVLGGLFFCIWVIRREQRIFGWYAAMALCWVLFIANILMTSPWPFSTTLMAARFNGIALVMYVTCFCVFVWRFGGQSLPRLEKALWLLTAALVALMALAPDARVGNAQLVAVLSTATVFFLNCLQFQLHALRTRRPEHVWLAASLLIFMLAGAHDLLIMLKLIGETPAWTPLTSVVTTLCMSVVLGLRHARSVRRIERFNLELAEGIERARGELATTLEREHALALTNSRLQDRLQIAHDLHDGLGGSLVRMMAMVEQASTPLQGPQFLSMLKLLRDDLRQTIDNGSSAGIKVPATPQEWIAPLRHRFTQLFDELDVTCTWYFAAQWRTPPSALQCMALTRLVEESLTNVVKHSRARQVQVELQQPQPDSLELNIEDDGIGFDVLAVQRAGVSVGMRSMHARIARVGGQLEVVSLPGCTRLVARLALQREVPASV